MRLAPLCLVLAVLLCGCAPAVSTTPPLATYPSTMTLDGSLCGVACTMTAELSAPFCGKFTFTAPAELAGISISLSGLPDTNAEAATLSYAELSVPLTAGADPAALYALLRALTPDMDALSATETSGSHTQFTFTYPTGYATLTTDADGTPTALTYDLYGTTATLEVHT